jgi:hypothetical protein
VRKLRGAEGGECLAEEDAAPEEVLELVEGVVPGPPEGGRGEGTEEEVEVAAEDAQGFVEFRGDGELGGVI